MQNAHDADGRSEDTEQMNVLILKLECDRCHKTFDLRTPKRQYVFNHDRLDVMTTRGWCHAEASVTEIEFLPTPDKIDHDIAGLEDCERAAQQMGFEPDPETDCDIQYLRKFRPFAETRTDPPRCLQCGSTQIDKPITEKGGINYVIHPGCGGRIDIVNMDFEQASDESPGYILHDAHGRVLARYADAPEQDDTDADDM